MLSYIQWQLAMQQYTVYKGIVYFCIIWTVSYRIAGKFGGGKFGEFGELSMIRQTKTIQISTYN